MVSIELNTVKDINSRYKKYNLVVSMFPSKDNYARNNLSKHGVKVEYQKEDLSQVNHQLYEWLATINDRSSTDRIPEKVENVKRNEKNNSEKVNFSLAPSSDKVVMSRGEREKQRAQYQSDRVYNKKEIAEIVKSVKVLSNTENKIIFSKRG